MRTRVYDTSPVVRIRKHSLDLEPGDQSGKAWSFHVLPSPVITTDPEWNFF